MDDGYLLGEVVYSFCCKGQEYTAARTRNSLKHGLRRRIAVLFNHFDTTAPKSLSLTYPSEADAVHGDRHV